LGADGHIAIWRFDKILAAFPEDGEKLAFMLPQPYIDELDGVKYLHSYWGEPDYSRWAEHENWLYVAEGYPTVERQREFLAWLVANKSGEWEVWT
jgi:hypothetical protein